ncbi:MAG: LamG-like jellyroll fold domain-containing protein [Melioribacteraceae bacterium]|nr:LamG-like jellyroll fold domain-containing protein [Melioribacteraceae bacterium]
MSTNLVDDNWQHVTFVYSANNKTLLHYVNGKLLDENDDVSLKKLESGAEDYMSIARNGMWENPLSGKLDELRFSAGRVYTSEFSPPKSFSEYYTEGYEPEKLAKGQPLLFDEENKNDTPLKLGDRKHLFIDDAFIEEMGDVEFSVNPPKKAEMVIGDIEGPFRKHLTVMEDEEGLIRIYNSAEDDYMIVHTSKDGINFRSPEYRHRASR